MLLKLATMGALAAAVLLPLYYLADATGFSVTAVVTHVFVLNLALAALALLTLLWPTWPVQIGALAAGGALVISVLRRFANPRPIQVAA